MHSARRRGGAEAPTERTRGPIMTNPLPNCPFCGGSDLNEIELYSEEYEGDSVECNTCHAQAPLPAWICRADRPFNRLTPAESERLALLVEECGEVLQMIGKVTRHGYESRHPNGGDTNRQALEKECGDVRHAMIRLCESGDLSKQEIHDAADRKSRTCRVFLHHQ